MVKRICFFHLLLLSGQLMSPQGFSWGGKGPDAVVDMGTPVYSDVVTITGYFSDTMVFDSLIYISKGSSNAFLVDLFPFEYAPDLPDSLLIAYSPTYSSGMAVATYYFEHYYWAGIFSDSLILKNRKLSGDKTGTDIFLAKVDGITKEVYWLRAISGPGDDAVYGAMQRDDTLFLAGEFTDKLFINNDTLTSSGQTDALVLKIDSSGNIVRYAQFGSPDSDRATSITFSWDKFVYVTGYFSDTVTFGDTQLISQGGTDIFLLKLDKNLHPLWALQWGGSGDDFPTRVRTAEQNRVCLSANYLDSLTVYPAPVASAGQGQNGLIAVINPDGTVYWQKTLRGPGENEISDIMFWGDEYVITGKIDSISVIDTVVLPDVDNDMFVFPIWNDGTIFLDNYPYYVFKGNGNNAITRISSIDILIYGIVIVGYFTDTITLFDRPGIPSHKYLENYNPSPDCFISGKIFGMFGLPALSGGGNLRIYPNPTDGAVRVWLPTPGSPAGLSVFSATGQLVLHRDIPAGTVSMDLSLRQLPKGLYVVRLQTKEKVFTGKVVLE